MNLHMFSFDSELDNVTKNNKGGDWKDREVLELKAFHNEQDGQMYANQESITGMFNVFWNFIYTGTPYALHRKVNQRNFGTGMSTRLAVIPMPDKGKAGRHQKVDPEANETLKTWAYRLDKVEGELAHRTAKRRDLRLAVDTSEHCGVQRRQGRPDTFEAYSVLRHRRFFAFHSDAALG